MVSPFEDPRKTELRERAKVAIDAAGHELLAEPQAISLPVGAQLKGSLLGDLQSRDGAGTTYVYYLRPESSRPLPQWLSNLARAAFSLEAIRFYVVVDRLTDVMQRTCEAHGAGLLALTAENTFEHIVDPAALDLEEEHLRFSTEVRKVRRDMERKVSFRRSVLEEHYARVDELTAEMTDKKRDEYIDDVERSMAKLEGWGETISTMLDEVDASMSASELEVIRQMIEEGVEQ